MSRKKTAPSASLKGDLFLLGQNQQSFTSAQIQLLLAIDECGSISAAAKQVGISYKTAWDRIDAMNNLSDQPLVIRSIGGAHGGGTVLTELGRRITEGFQVLQDEHKAFVEQLGGKLQSVGDLAHFISSGNKKSSARNQFRGRITAVVKGAINSEVVLEIADSQSLVVIITNDSVKELGLKKGGYAIALIKASWVVLSTDAAIKTSARNKLTGIVSRVVPGAVNSEVILDLGQGKTLCAVITNPSVEQLALRKGVTACAMFKASSVILMAG